MRDVVIKAGVYGRRDEKGRVLPVARGERVTLSDEEAARLVALDVAVYADAPAKAPDKPPAPPPVGEEEPGTPDDTPGADPATEAATGGEEEPGTPDDTPGADPATEAATGGEEGGSADAEVAKLERMQKVDLEQMAADMGLDVSGAKTKHDLAVLIVAAGEPEDGDTPPDLGVGDIVQ